MFLLFIISNFLLIFEEINKSNFEIQYHKSDIKVSTIKFNDQYYFSIKELSKIFVLNNDVNAYEYYLKYKDEELIFSDLSFFIVYRSSSQMRVAQMSHPAIKINDVLWIPINPFLVSMNSLNLINSQIQSEFSIDIIDYSIFELQERITVRKEATENKSNELKDKIPKDSTIIIQKKSKKDIIKFYDYDKNQTIERGKYSIPQSIKK